MAAIQIESLTKSFGSGEDKIEAVNSLDINVKDGELLALVGPSGCGKSTTLRCIAGLETVTSGNIYINGENATDKKPKDRDIAMVFQNYALYPHFTARKNMSLGLEMNTRMSVEEIEDAVNEAANTMDITELLDYYPKDLSGGQQQRVALGRAIVRDPEVFLMDEPLSNLDAKLRTQMRTELQNLQNKLDVATVYVTHDQTEAMTMGDRIAILNNGKLQQIGTPMECYTNPVNKFVAGFIGSPSMNFTEVSSTREKDSIHIKNEHFDYVLNEKDRNENLTATGQIILGIRPEDINISVDKDPRTIKTQVIVAEPLGNLQICYFKLSGQKYTASFMGKETLHAGDEIYVDFPQESISLFAKSNGKALINNKNDDMHNIQQTH